MKSTVILLFVSLFLFSCVSSKKYKQAQTQYGELNARVTTIQGDLANCNTEKK